MSKYTLHDAGEISTWSGNSVEIPEREVTFSGKAFLKEPLNLTSCEVSLNALKPGEGSTFCHTHIKNEEVYVFLQGQGEFQIDDEVLSVKAGHTLRVSPEGARAWRNTGDSEFVFFVIQAKKDSLEEYTVEDADVPDLKVAWM